MNIAVCDDEKVISEHIRDMILKKRPDSCVATYTSGEEMLLSDRSFDIVFLDIMMKGMNGIDTAKRLRKINEDTVIIFITGVKEYVFDAFDVSAFHYLLKPVREDKFDEVLGRAVHEADKRKDHGHRTLFLKTKKRGITLDIEDITYIESRAKKVEIHTIDRSIELYSTMSELEAQLGSSFYRCHRGYIVNMAYISEYSNDSIILSSGETVYMAKEKYNVFVKRYMRYLRNGGAPDE